MVRLTPMTPPDLDLSLPIGVDWRPGSEVWSAAARPGHIIGSNQIRVSKETP